MKYYRRARKRTDEAQWSRRKQSADCICLFALHHMDAFPIDTHIRQVLDEHYRRGFPNRRYHGMRGIMQQYIFYYEPDRKREGRYEVFCKCAGGCSLEQSIRQQAHRCLYAVLIMCVYMLGRKQGIGTGSQRRGSGSLKKAAGFAGHFFLVVLYLYAAFP